MGQLIQDIKPLTRNVPSYLRGYGTQGRVAKRLRTDVLISELYRRGVSIEDIFGQFYALEEMASARDDEIFGNDEEGQHGRQPLTVGDAQLAFGSQQTINYNQPF